jgi:hypothetical protein
MLAIVNVSESRGIKYGTGEQVYEVRINYRVLCEVRHVYEDGAAELFRKAAIALDARDKTNVDSVRERLANIIKPEAIDDWLTTHNDSFGCRPIDVIQSGRMKEIEAMLFVLETGMPG